MSSIYIICAIIVSIIIAITTLVVAEGIDLNRKINLNWVLLMITLVLGCSLVMVLINHNQNDITIGEVKEAYSDGYEDGYNTAIENAVLVESNENGYTLSFNGEKHVYTYD